MYVNHVQKCFQFFYTIYFLLNLKKIYIDIYVYINIYTFKINCKYVFSFYLQSNTLKIDHINCILNTQHFIYIQHLI